MMIKLDNYSHNFFHGWIKIISHGASWVLLGSLYPNFVKKYKPFTKKYLIFPDHFKNNVIHSSFTLHGSVKIHMTKFLVDEDFFQRSFSKHLYHWIYDRWGYKVVSTTIVNVCRNFDIRHIVWRRLIRTVSFSIFFLSVIKLSKANASLT